MNDVDFGRSFIRFTTDRPNHTPRLQVDAACSLTGPDGQERRYYLTCPCIAERMYAETGLIHEPTAEFHMIGLPGREFLMLKRMPSATQDIRSAHRVGEAMPTKSGVPAKVTQWEADVRRFARVEPITGAPQFRAALLEGRPINGRTTYQDAQMRIVMDYPARTVNIANDQEAWQVDAGPVLIPSEPQEGDLMVTRFNLAYLVFNRWVYGEAAVRCATPLGDGAGDGSGGSGSSGSGGGGGGGGQTAHYSRMVRLECKNELFAAAV